MLALGLVLGGRLDPSVAMIDAPHAVRQPLAEMAENDLQPRIGIEQPGSDQAQRMDGGLLSERPGRAEQPGMAGIDPGIVFRQRIARMQIEGNAELLDLSQNGQYCGRS